MTSKKKYFSVIKDKSIEEIKNMNFLKCVFNLTNNYSNLINTSNNYDYLLKIIFDKAIQEISVNKINLILVEVILECIFCNNNITNIEFENILDKILIYLENEKNRIEISLSLGKNKIIRVFEMLQARTHYERFERRLQICVEQIYLILVSKSNLIFDYMYEGLFITSNSFVSNESNNQIELFSSYFLSPTNFIIKLNCFLHISCPPTNLIIKMNCLLYTPS